MKKYLLAVMILACLPCIYQTVNTESTFFNGRTFKEIWEASIRAVTDIDFTIDGMDMEAGFIGAESGLHILGGTWRDLDLPIPFRPRTDRFLDEMNSETKWEPSRAI